MEQFECPFSLYGRKAPNRVALTSAEKKWTYQECERLIVGTASLLKKQGVKKGDRVALLPTKEFPSPLIFFALFRLGAIACPLNTYDPLTLLPEKLDRLGAPLLLFPDGTALPKMKQITLHFSKVIHKGKPSGQTFLEKKALATYLFTSGTTGKAKIACHSLGNHYYSALGSNRYLPIGAEDRYQLSLPLYHIAGIALLFRTFLAGGAVAFSEEGITHLSLVPTQLKRLLDKETLPNYKHILLGGAPISPTLYQEARGRGLPIHPTYGMTEMSSQITSLFDESPLSMGHPLPYREIKIGTGGEIWVRGKALFQGYLDEGLPLNSEGYFETGDLGTYCPKQGLQISGRKDRLFISGGENIYPEEIERLLQSIEGITYAEVVPTPDEEFGFRPTAYIESDQGYEEEALKSYLEDFLPRFKIPIAFLASSDGFEKRRLSPKW
ncbi:o-succinylbenzoate--CoA ligase [Candidatus Neptunochlamydia vexilliferae]|nr:o-succinylbenzoate--CoA ligase [Candidatus Neptunochlamydia vexilliferae]